MPAAGRAGLGGRALRLIAGAALIGLARPGDLAGQPDSLTTAVGAAIAAERLVGAVWAVVTPTSTTLGAAGVRNADLGTPMRPTDRVQVGSVAKTLIATGVLRLATLGRVDLDAPVETYLPDLRIDNQWRDSAPLLVRHLLDHTGGLDDARMWQVFSLRADPDTPLRNGVPRSIRVRHPPGARFSYSNTGYTILGMLIEAVAGVRYERWLADELLAPLGMSRSTFEFVTQTGPAADSTLAMGHFDAATTSATVPSFVRPAGQFTTTADDMARLARFLMSDGRVAGQVHVDPRLLAAMATPTTTEAARAGLAAGYGLGLARRDRHGVVARCHLGNTGTFRASLCVVPEQGRGFFVAFNSDPETGNFDRIDGLLAGALGLPPTAERAPAPADVDPAAWAGWYLVRPNRFDQFRYLDELTGLTRVRWDGRQLLLRPVQGSARQLIPVGGALLRATDRREASHVLIRDGAGRPLISDGQRTYARQAPLRLGVLWASAVSGLLSLAYLLLIGGWRTVAAIRRGHWRREPLRWPVVGLGLLVVAPVLFLRESFLTVGDPTFANSTVATLTGLLPLAMLIGVAGRVRAGLRGPAARLDLVMLVAGLQWCGVLAAWGLLPLALWR
ncbi:MAG: serine hydrolase domain-containing protein [Gemmatimonadales bacterium]|nr:serine hydrolase domain-containing protein [Gemmatimonadales bacterium]